MIQKSRRSLALTELAAKSRYEKKKQLESSSHCSPIWKAQREELLDFGLKPDLDGKRTASEQSLEAMNVRRLAIAFITGHKGGK